MKEKNFNKLSNLQAIRYLTSKTGNIYTKKGIPLLLLIQWIFILKFLKNNNNMNLDNIIKTNRGN